MKKINLKSVFAIVFAIGISSSNYAQQNHDHSKMNMKTDTGKMMKMKHDKGSMSMMQQKGTEAQFNDANLNKAYMHYIMINTALTKSNTQKVKMMSKMLANILNNYGKATKSVAIANKLSESTDLKGQRKLFAELTTSMEPIFKNNITKGKVYKNYCPMANGNGAYWFSNSENIVNPYMGTKSTMSSCGSVKETFKSM